MPKENNIEIEKLTRGQSSNKCWFTFIKAVITGSKGHEIITKVYKVQKPTGCHIDMYSFLFSLNCGLFLDDVMPFIGTSPVELYRVCVVDFHVWK